MLISFSTSWKASIVQLFDILEISSRVSFGLLSRFADHSHEPILAGSDTQIVGVSIWLQLLSIVLMKWLAACLAAAFSMPSKLIELTNVRLPTIDLKTWWLGRPQDRRVSDMAVCVTCDMQRGFAVCSDRSDRVPNYAGEGRVKELLNNKLSSSVTSDSALSTAGQHSACFSEYSTEKNFVLPRSTPRTFVPLWLVSFFFSPFGTNLQNAVFMYSWTSNIDISSKLWLPSIFLNFMELIFRMSNKQNIAFNRASLLLQLRSILLNFDMSYFWQC